MSTGHVCGHGGGHDGGHGHGPRKSVRLVRIFLDKSISRGQFWSETTRKTNGQTVTQSVDIL